MTNPNGTSALPATTLADVREQARQTARDAAEEYVTDLSNEDGAEGLAHLIDTLDEGGEWPELPHPSEADAAQVADTLDGAEDFDDDQREQVIREYVETFTEEMQPEAERHARRMLAGYAAPGFVTVDGEPVEVDDPYGVERVAVSINEEGATNAAQSLAWANSARIHLDAEEDSITVAISVGDPRGAFTMTIRRIPADAEGEHAGRLVMYLPHPGMGFAHAELHEIHPGTFRVG